MTSDGAAETESVAERLARAVLARQRQLGLSQIELAGRAGLSVATVRKLTSGQTHNFRDQTLARLSESLEWPADALRRVADGGELPDGDARRRSAGSRVRNLAAMASRLTTQELHAVERLVAELTRGRLDRADED